jgi:hypothetical protein
MKGAYDRHTTEHRHNSWWITPQRTVGHISHTYSPRYSLAGTEEEVVSHHNHRGVLNGNELDSDHTYSQDQQSSSREFDAVRSFEVGSVREIG